MDQSGKNPLHVGLYLFLLKKKDCYMLITFLGLELSLTQTFLNNPKRLLNSWAMPWSNQ